MFGELLFLSLGAFIFIRFVKFVFGTRDCYCHSFLGVEATVARLRIGLFRGLGSAEDLPEGFSGIGQLIFPLGVFCVLLGN